MVIGVCEQSRGGGKQLDTDCLTLQFLDVLWPPCSQDYLKADSFLWAPASCHVAVPFLQHTSPLFAPSQLTTMLQLPLASLAEQFLRLQFTPRQLPQGHRGSIPNTAVL